MTRRSNASSRLLHRSNVDVAAVAAAALVPAKAEQQQQQLQCLLQPGEEFGECIAIVQATTIPDSRKRESDPKNQTLSQLIMWPVRLFSTACCWLTVELGHLLEETNGLTTSPRRRCTSPEDPAKFIPSVAAFVFGLVVVKNYGDTLDRAIVRCLGSWSRALRGLFNLLAGLTLSDFESLAKVCMVLLVWVGAIRIVRNVFGTLVETPKLFAQGIVDKGVKR